MRRKRIVLDTSNITFQPKDPQSSPPAVLLVCDALSSAGVGRHVSTLAVGLARAGHPVTVACARDSATDGGLTDAGVAVRPAGESAATRRSMLRYIEHLRRIIAVERPAVVHAHMRASVTAAAHAVSEADVLVITEHGDPAWGDTDVRRDLAAAYARADAVIAVSQRVSQRVVSAGVEHSRVHVIPDAVRTAETPALLPPPGRDAWLVGMVAPLTDDAGVDVFLRAASSVLADLPRTRFLVVGDGAQRASLERLAERLGIRDRVGFLAHRSDLSALMLRLSVLCAPVGEESSPAVAREAMAIGVPVITVESSAAELRRARCHAMVLRRWDDTALSRSISKLLRRRRLARRLAQAARARALYEFSPERMLDSVVEVYASCLGECEPASVPETVLSIPATA